MDKPKEAFKDEQFLESPEGRSIRILSEYEKVKSLFEIHKIVDTITFFGSARFKSKEHQNNNSEIDSENSEYYEQARPSHLNLLLGQKNIQRKEIDL